MCVSIATVNTGHFDFMAIGRDPEHAKDLVMFAWNRHADLMGADRRFLSRDDINVITGAIGEVYRDSGRLIDATETTEV